MARVVGIDHLVIRVKGFERSRAFYDTVLGFLGFKRLIEQVLGREIDLVEYGGLAPKLDDDIRREAVLL